MADNSYTPTPIAAKRFADLTGQRQAVLERARNNSDLTIPGLIPREGQDANSAFTQPYQSLGARAVNNLGSWLLVTLFPPDQNFFRINIHEDVADELGAAKSEVQTALSRISSKAQMVIETSASRPVFMEVLRHLIVAGNALLHIPMDKTSPRMWRIDQYVILRDDRGRILEIVVEEKVYPSTLDEETIAACKVDAAKGEEREKAVTLYTHVKRVGDDFHNYQEINRTIVPGSEGKSPAKESGWMALRWNAVAGSDYGRAHVSEYFGDLQTLEDLNRSVVQFAAAASRIVYLVDPNAMVDIETLASAESGEFITGYLDRIQSLQLDKSADFQVADAVAQRIELRLSHAFLLQSGTVRNAERVTAEEIRAMAQELENVLGGVYTVLSAEFQLPLVRRLLYILVRSGDSPKLPDNVQPSIVTGFEALGRNHSANKLRMWLGDMINTFGPQVVQERTNPSEIGRRFADNYGIEDVDALILSDEEVAQNSQQGMMNQAMMQSAPQIAKGAVDAASAAATPEEG